RLLRRSGCRAPLDPSTTAPRRDPSDAPRRGARGCASSTPPSVKPSVGFEKGRVFFRAVRDVCHATNAARPFRDRSDVSWPSAAVLCEKPFTLAASEARRLSTLARNLGRIALIDHQLRMSPPRRRLRALLRTGAIGTAWVARSEMCFGSVERLTRKASWWDDVARGGGVMQAVGSHLVDGLLWILGPIVDVQ